MTSSPAQIPTSRPHDPRRKRRLVPRSGKKGSTSGTWTSGQGPGPKDMGRVQLTPLGTGVRWEGGREDPLCLRVDPRRTNSWTVTPGGRGRRVRNRGFRPYPIRPIRRADERPLSPREPSPTAKRGVFLFLAGSRTGQVFFLFFYTVRVFFYSIGNPPPNFSPR